MLLAGAPAGAAAPPPLSAFERRLLASFERLLAASKDRTIAARLVEEARWPDGPACEHCASTRVAVSGGDGTDEAGRRRRWFCRDCHAACSVRKGTFLEGGRVPFDFVCYALVLALRARDEDQIARGLALFTSRETARKWAAIAIQVCERSAPRPPEHGRLVKVADGMRAALAALRPARTAR